MAKQPNINELEEGAILHDRIAAHYRALAELEREIAGRIERTDLFAVLVADTAIAEQYTDPAKCLAWLSASHRSWLRINLKFNEMASRQAFFRYVVLPYPALVRNLAKRKLLTEIILLNLHLHLWHGVICGVVFVDPRKGDLAKVVEDLNFVSIPSQRVFLDTPGFYRGDGLRTSIVTDSRADQMLSKARRLLAGGKGEPIWLHYDDANFGGPRLKGWRWNALRTLFRELYGPEVRCTMCAERIESFDLDHIAPVAHGYYQTINNFRPMCSKHNREKGALVGENPYLIKIVLPDEFVTPTLEDIQRLPPPWLGNMASPNSVGDIETKLAGG